MESIWQSFNLQRLQKIISNPLVFKEEFLILLFIAVTLVLIIVVFFLLLVFRSPRVKVKEQSFKQRSQRTPTLLIIFAFLTLLGLLLFLPTSNYLSSDRLCLSCHKFNSLSSFSHQKQSCRSCHVRFGLFGLAANNVAMSAKLLNKYLFLVGQISLSTYEANCWECHKSKIQQTLVKEGKKLRHENLLNFSCLTCHQKLRHR